MARLPRSSHASANGAADDDAPPPAGPPSAGEALRRQREALGLNLGEVAAALRIKLAYLEALEAGRPDELPGPTYAIGFTRAYADHLRLDREEILRRFKQDPAAFARKPDLAFPMPLGERSIPGAGVLLIAAILAVCAYGTWYYLSTAEQSRPQRVTEVPAELLASESERPVTRSTEALAAASATAPTENAPAAGEAPKPPSESAAPPVDPAISSSPAPTGAAEAATQTAAVEPVSPPQSPSAANGTSPRIMLHAVADSWVQIHDASQSVLVTRVLKAGESYAVPDRPGLAMRTGNAGGLEITVDDNRVPPIGPRGAVRRNVALEPQALMAGNAVRD
jgi:cytoskeleton protein RodZ